MKKVLSWPVYYQLSEIYTAPLNVIWFVFGAAMSFQQYHMFNLINILLCLVDVFCLIQQLILLIITMIIFMAKIDIFETVKQFV